MGPSSVVVDREVALYTDYFVAFHDRQGIWTVTHAGHIYVESPVADWTVWFAGHARDNSRHVFWCERTHALRCGDEQEALAIITQLELEYRAFVCHRSN